MKRLARALLASVFLSVMLAVLLSLAPVMSKRGSGSLPVFQVEQPIHLTEGTLVDFLSRQPMEMRLHHVEWERNNLSLDLSTTRLTNERYREIYLLIQRTLTQTDNVASVRLTVYNASPATPELLMTVRATRVDLRESPVVHQESGRSYLQYLERFFEVKRY
ncbi:hypothetical protein [Polycladomyces subterraneus]|uniref:Uncharacterized protein n=1 Tax=Polycladomyces subterraneus TaxID=1016997 RepID=A0ABT8IN34_9BACL|nr:hypothetical protein [Polycladomyces subterraneus]MDN4594218.1 hypothetical protein [Polycladomyces subterraneus]